MPHKNTIVIRNALIGRHSRPLIWCTVGNSRVYSPDGARQCGFNRTALSLFGSFRGQISTCGGHSSAPYQGNIHGTPLASDYVLAGGYGELAYVNWANMPSVQRTNVMPLGGHGFQFGPFYVPSGSQTPSNFLCITAVSPKSINPTSLRYMVFHKTFTTTGGQFAPVLVAPQLPFRPTVTLPAVSTAGGDSVSLTRADFDLPPLSRDASPAIWLGSSGSKVVGPFFGVGVALRDMAKSGGIFRSGLIAEGGRNPCQVCDQITRAMTPASRRAVMQMLSDACGGDSPIFVFDCEFGVNTNAGYPSYRDSRDGTVYATGTTSGYIDYQPSEVSTYAGWRMVVFPASGNYNNHANSPDEAATTITSYNPATKAYTCSPALPSWATGQHRCRLSPYGSDDVDGNTAAYLELVRTLIGDCNSIGYAAYAFVTAGTRHTNTSVDTLVNLSQQSLESAVPDNDPHITVWDSYSLMTTAEMAALGTTDFTHPTAATFAEVYRRGLNDVLNSQDQTVTIPTLSQISSAVRTELAPELGRIDVPVSSVSGEPSPKDKSEVL